MDRSHEPWLRFGRVCSLMYCVIYISTPLRFAQYLIVEHRASFHRTSATHAATRAPVGGKEEYPSLSASYLRLFLWLILHVQEAGWIRPWHSFLPPLFCRIVAPLFSALHDTRCKWALGGSESVALNVDFCGTSGSLSPKLMKQIYDGCWAQQIKLTVMYGGLMPPWSLHSTTGRSLPG